MREREWELYDFHYDNVPKVDNDEFWMFLLISQLQRRFHIMGHILLEFLNLYRECLHFLSAPHSKVGQEFYIRVWTHTPR